MEGRWRRKGDGERRERREDDLRKGWRGWRKGNGGSRGGGEEVEGGEVEGGEGKVGRWRKERMGGRLRREGWKEGGERGRKVVREVEGGEKRVGRWKEERKGGKDGKRVEGG